MTQPSFPISPSAVELDAAILQVAVALGLAGFAAFLYRRYRKPHFAWFSITWALYLARLLAIMAFNMRKGAPFLETTRFKRMVRLPI